LDVFGRASGNLRRIWESLGLKREMRDVTFESDEARLSRLLEAAPNPSPRRLTVTPRELLNGVKLRTWARVIAGEGKVSFLDAQQAAAREVASEERQRKRSVTVQHAANTREGITVKNAKAVCSRSSPVSRNA
jgi:hypothetical protein